ncbi:MULTISPECIES: hypothetical protein [Kitasatospora]|nr:MULTISPECIES: hypothetical protein [Kitasatospora]
MANQDRWLLLDTFYHHGFKALSSVGPLKIRPDHLSRSASAVKREKRAS